MNDYEIDKILKGHPLTKNIFLKTVPCDSLISSEKFPYAIVMNTDDSEKPGVHWTAIYANSINSAEYFDSYGRQPNSCIAKYLEKFENVKKNHDSIQSPFSTACGHFCCLFIILRSDGRNFEQITKNFKNMGPDRDKYVQYLVRKIEKKI